MNTIALKGAVIIGLIMIIREQQKPRGIRNNNPLNIRETGTKWRGKVGDDGEFTQFESAEMGIRAGAKILKTYRDKYGLTSIFDIIMRWSPPSENDTTSYIDAVSATVGVGRNESLKDYDYPLLIGAMIKHENGQQPYDASTIENGFKMGFYS